MKPPAPTFAPVRTLALVAAALAVSGAVHAATLVTSADSYINQDQPDTNYGTQSFLQLKNNTDAFDRKIYFQLDLTAIPDPIDSATITLTISNSTGTAAGNLGGNRTFTLWGLTTESAWTETGITWNNAPANDPDGSFTSAATLFVSQAATSSDSVVTFTLNQAAVDFLNNDTNDIVTFMVFRTNNNATVDTFFSRDSAFAGPTLTYTTVPEPGSVALFLTGLGALAARVRRRTRQAAGR